MGFFKLSEQQKKVKRERKAFKRIVKAKTTQAARKAFSEEAVKVATERGKAKARRPSILTRAKVGGSRILGEVGKAALKQATKKPRTTRRKQSRRTQPTGFNINDLL